MVFQVQSLTIGLDPTWKLVLRSFTQGLFLIISYLFQYYFWPNLIIRICMQALHLTVSFCGFCDFYLDQGVCGLVVFRVQLLTIGLDPTWKLVLRSFTQGLFLIISYLFQNCFLPNLIICICMQALHLIHGCLILLISIFLRFLRFLVGSGYLWLSGISGSIAYNWSWLNMKTGVKILHARFVSYNFLSFPILFLT